MEKMVVAMLLVTAMSVAAAPEEGAMPEERLPEGFLEQRSASPAIAVCEGPAASEVVACRGGTDRQIAGRTTVHAMASLGWRLVAVVPLQNDTRLKYFFQK